MKSAINMKWNGFLLVLGFALFFSAGAANAQNGQQSGKGPRFAQCDQNGGGVISQSECRNGNFARFDGNGDGQLSKNECRKIKKNQKAYNGKKGATRKAEGQGQGQGFKNGQGSQKGYAPGKGQGSGQMLRTQSRILSPSGARAGRGGRN